MEFQKIQLTKSNTLNVVFKNGDGDIVSVTGANIVHKDLRQALNALIPHLAIVTEQREAYKRNLKQVQADRITDESNDSVFKRLDVDCVTFSEDETKVSISGSRILLSGCVIKLSSPVVNVEDDENYEYCNELSLDIQKVKYEASQYLEEKKWGIKQAEIEFEDPFEGVKAEEVPEAEVADINEKPKKRGRKAKAA
jgi:hypothetical protein